MSGLTRRTMLAGSGAGLASARMPAALPGSGWLDDLVSHAMAAFGVPGLAIGMVTGARDIWARGWGVRALGAPDRVDERTIFPIASHSKAMTAAALAMLVEAGHLAWDAPVTRYLPDFRMFDPFASQAMTLRDLLVHCSGLGLGAGDLLFFPRADFTREELVHAIRYLKPARSFRSGYAYDNVLYVVAGALVEAVAGMRWEAFVTERLFDAIGMTDSRAAPSLVRASNRAAPHGRVGGRMRGLGPMQRLAVVQDRDHVAPAGGVHSTARDMARWLRVQINAGQADGRRLWSASSAQEMWTPRTIIRATGGPSPHDPGLPLFEGYALGWKVRDYRGLRAICHTGFLQGAASATMIVPSIGLGLSVLTNAEETGAHAAILNSVADRLTGAAPFDWIGFYKRAGAQETAEAVARLSAQPPLVDGSAFGRGLDAYPGRYRDAWYGDIHVGKDARGLTIDFTRSPDLHGAMIRTQEDVFLTDFGNPELEDAAVTFLFAPGQDKANALRIRPKSPLADFSYDYHDLDPRRS